VSQNDDSPQKAPEEVGEGVPPGPAATPIDHPYFLPALLALMTVWFGYDGFIDAEMQKEHPVFNRVGFAVLLPLTLWFGYKGWKEVQAQKAEENEDSEDRG